MTELPSSVSLSEWRGKFHLIGGRKLGEVPTWVICGEVISLDSGQIPAD